MSKNILIILIFHNEKSFNDTFECIDSLYKMQFNDYDIVVVNNGVKLINKDLLVKKYPQIIYISSDKNLGFAGGNNLGIEYGLKKRYKYFLLLNSDTIVDKEFLKLLKIRIDSNKSIGMVGPKTFYYSKRDKIWANGGYIIKWRALVGGLNEKNERKGEYINFFKLKNKIFNSNKKITDNNEVDYLPASCILVKREVIKKIGKLPEYYFFAYEEAEFALKVKKAGFRVVVEPKSKIWHKVGLSNTRDLMFYYNSYRSRLMFLKHNYIYPVNNILIFILLLVKFLQPKTNRRLLLYVIEDHVKYNKISENHLVKIKEKFKNKMEAF